METNPYTVPTADPFGSSSANTAAGLTEGIFRHLKGTKGWVKLVAILCFLVGGLMVMGGLALFLLALFGGGLLASMGGEGSPLAGLGGVIGGAIIGGIYAALGAIYLYPGLKLWGYASAIDDLLKDRAVLTLEKALDCQRAFWKFVGVFIIVMISLYVLIFAAAIIFGGIAAATAAAAGS